MSSSDPAEQLRAILRGERQAIDRHPPPEQIVAYHERRLSAEAVEEVRAHLVACPDCTAELLALTDLLDRDGGREPEISRADLDAAWRRQQDRRLTAARLLRWPAVTPLRRAWATAASLGLAAALLAGVAAVQWRTIARLGQPQANPPLVNLAPAGSVRQGAQPVPELRLPAEAARAWVILNPDVEAGFDSYDVEVFGPGGEVVLRFEDIPISEAGNFRLEIPREDLAAGDYRFVLSGRKGEQRRAVAELPSPRAPSVMI